MYYIIIMKFKSINIYNKNIIKQKYKPEIE